MSWLARANCLGSSSAPKKSSRRPPNSILIHQALADYYTAARDRDKARMELTTISQLRPDDANLRLRVAEQMLRDGQASEAIVHFKAAFKKNPSLLSRVSLSANTDRSFERRQGRRATRAHGGD